MIERDDPQHPDFSGISFRAATDKSGVIITPSAAATAPPYTFVPATIAASHAIVLGQFVEDVRARDPGSYLATFLDSMLDDYTAAIAACREVVQ